MRLKEQFAAALLKVGLYPKPLAQAQLLAAIKRDDAAAARAILCKSPAAATSFETPTRENRFCASAFEIAVCEKKFDAAKAMAAVVPDVLTRDYSRGEVFLDRTILMQRAIKSTDVAEIEFLIGLGLDIKAKDTSGNTALHLAASLGHLDTVKVLLAHGAEANARNECGATPLMAAAGANAKFIKDHDKVMDALVAGGADMALKDNAGDQPFNYAMRGKNWSIAMDIAQKSGMVDMEDPAIRDIYARKGSVEALEFLDALDKHGQYRETKAAVEGLHKGLERDVTMRPLKLKLNPAGAFA